MLVGPGAEDSISGTVSACSSGKIYRLCGDGRLACVAITGPMRLGGKRLPLANGPFPRFALMCASAKKGPRSQRVPGGLRTHRFPGAIGRSAAARPCAPCPQAATLLTKRLRQPPCRRPAPRSAETCPKARSRCGLATWPHQVSDLGQPQISGIDPAGRQRQGSDGRENMPVAKTGQGRFFRIETPLFTADGHVVDGWQSVASSLIRRKCFGCATRAVQPSTA